MAAKDIWDAVHAERHALARDLSTLSEAQWQTTSWCKEWSVRDVVAHMTAAATMNPASFFAKLVANGFSFSKLQAKDIARERGASSAETLARFQGILDSTSHPPGPTITWLGESLVHAEDVRRPLGITRAYPIDRAVQVADLLRRLEPPDRCEEADRRAAPRRNRRRPGRTGRARASRGRSCPSCSR